MVIDQTMTKGITSIIVYSWRDENLHIWVAEELEMCPRICMLSGASKDESVLIQLPKLTRKFPPWIELLLPLRRSLKC